MKTEDIIRMAREADEGFETDTFHEESLVGMDAIERFSRLVAAAERDKYEAKFKQLEALMQAREQQPNKPCCLAEREACAAWVRTNYMDHSVDSLCESLRARSNT